MALRELRTWSQMHQHPRNADPSNSHSYGDPTDQAVEVFKQLAKEQLIPQIANRTRNAISVDGRQVFFYQRLRSGRRCSCWGGNESTPNPECPICFNTGFAGGYLKWGTDLYQFDPSRVWSGVNVILNPLLGVPPWFTLEAGKISGYLEWETFLEQAIYYGIDSWRFDYRKGKGSISLKFMLVGSDVDFVDFTEEALKQRILVANGGKFKFRIYLKRLTANDTSPMFLTFWFRALMRSADQPILLVDIPRRSESAIMAEYGALETFTTIQFVFSDEIKKINLEDMIIRLYDMTRWKVLEVSPNDPQNILTSHDIQARKVFQDEGMYQVPI